MKYSTQKDIAFALHVTPEQVCRWKKEGCEALKRPPYELEDVKKWRKGNKDATHDRHDMSDDRENLLHREKVADVRYRELQGENLEFHLAIERGELVYVEDREKIAIKQAELFKLELTNIGKHWANKLVGLTQEQASAVCTEMGNEILGRLYKGGT